MAGFVLDQHGFVRPQEIGFFLQLIDIIQTPDDLRYAAAKMSAYEFQIGDFSKIPRTIKRARARELSKGRPTLDASR